MKRIPIKADTYSLVNSIVPDYLALQSSLLPTNTSFRNTPRNCRTAERRYLTDKMSNPQLSNFSAMSLNASKHMEKKTSGSSLFSAICEKSVAAFSLMHHHK